MPMMVVINAAAQSALRSINVAGRAMRVHFSDQCHNNVSLVFLHGDHDEALATSLADAVELAKSRSKGSELVIIGDINVDQLPVLSNDPWQHLDGREEHHAGRRALLEMFADAVRLSVHLPDRVSSLPGGRICGKATACPFTRIPIGRQKGVPSLLDYALGAAGKLQEVVVDWDLAQGDHAALIVGLSCPYKRFPRWRRSTWKCSDRAHCKAWVAQNAARNFNSVDSFHTFAKSVQAEFEQVLTRSERRKRREPEWIKQLRGQKLLQTKTRGDGCRQNSFGAGNAGCRF